VNERGKDQGIKVAKRGEPGIQTGRSTVPGLRSKQQRRQHTKRVGVRGANGEERVGTMSLSSGDGNRANSKGKPYEEWLGGKRGSGSWRGKRKTKNVALNQGKDPRPGFVRRLSNVVHRNMKDGNSF